MNIEWGSIPFELQTPYSSDALTFNDDDNPVGLFLLDDAKCSVGAALRVTKDTIPQASGAIMHRPRLQAETLMTLGVEFWKDRENPACDSQLVDMNDLLFAHLNALLDADDGRVQWMPTGHDPRILDDVLWAVATSAFIEGAVRGYTFAIDSPFPYAITLNQVTTVIAAGGTATITNGGTAPFYPVVKVAPASSVPLSSFSLTNMSVLDDDGNPFTLVYDASLPGAVAIGAGHYVEFDFFRNTAYLDAPSQANRKAGIDITLSDFFPLNPGANVITVTGGDATFLTNDAWAG